MCILGIFPKTEANIIAVNPGWAEQDPRKLVGKLKVVHAGYYDRIRSECR